MFDLGAGEKSLQSRAEEVSAVAQLIDWDTQAKLPPDLCPIQEGSQTGLAIVLGQSLNKDGTAPQVLVDRARAAKQLLDSQSVSHIMVSGGDPAGTGRTEASQAWQVLVDAGVPPDVIIRESQATTTAENAWFALRWLPKGTGQLYIVTSDFHMARATYTFAEVFNYFYGLMQQHFNVKRYPHLAIHQVPARSYCGQGSSDSVSNAARAVNSQSLAQRAMYELEFLGSNEVPNALFGENRSKIMYIWPVSIDVSKDPENDKNFDKALAQAMHAVRHLCHCKAVPERPSGQKLDEGDVLAEVFPTSFPEGFGKESWVSVIQHCDPKHLEPVKLGKFLADAQRASDLKPGHNPSAHDDLPTNLRKRRRGEILNPPRVSAELTIRASLSTDR